MSAPLASRPALLAGSLLALAAGCGDAPTTGAPDRVLDGEERVSLSMVPVPPVGASEIRGVVIRADAQGREYGPVAGVRVTVRRVDVDPAARDTATARKTLVTVGTVTSGADGTFALRGVGRAYFALDVEPPASSGLAGGRAWSVSLLPTDPAWARVYLYAR